MNQYWETVNLIKGIGFSENELLQLLATDLQQYDLDGVREYLSACKQDFDESKERARVLLERIRQLKEE